jgi:hypothetical protein
MNGIVHMCKQVCDNLQKKKLNNHKGDKTEEQVVEEVLKYVESLLSVVIPNRVLFIAFDGGSFPSFLLLMIHSTSACKDDSTETEKIPLLSQTIHPKHVHIK